jgi:peroxiredoxin
MSSIPKSSPPSAFPLPPDLPVPKDDGASDHLLGARIPSGIQLISTRGNVVDAKEASKSSSPEGWVVFFFYPMTGKPGVPLPNGWDSIPGARGCTPESCSYRDLYAEFQKLKCDVYGISTQSPDDQKEFAQRSNIPYEILSDSKLELTSALRLPTFRVPEVGAPLIKRLTLVFREGQVTKVYYPVFPPDKNADQVLSYIRSS